MIYIIALFSLICPIYHAEDLVIESASLEKKATKGYATLSQDAQRISEIPLKKTRCLKDAIFQYASLEKLGPLSQITVYRDLSQYMLIFEEVDGLPANAYLLLPGDRIEILSKIRRQ